MKNRKKRFLKDNFVSSIDYIVKSKKYIYISAAIFLFFILVGYFIPAPEIISEKISEFIKNLLSQTEGMSLPQLFAYIFFNNLQSSFFALMLGAILGIFPIISILGNGYLLGFVSKQVSDSSGLLALWRILPHGIFEIPAILISTGLGLKLGTFIFKKNKTKTFEEFLVNSIRTFFFVVLPLLLVAGIIESSLIFFLK